VAASAALTFSLAVSLAAAAFSLMWCFSSISAALADAAALAAPAFSLMPCFSSISAALAFAATYGRAQESLIEGCASH
jgi:hypothetical protein